MNRPKYLAVDIETTGLSPRDDIMLEIGAVLLDERLDHIDRFHAIGGVSGSDVRYILEQRAEKPEQRAGALLVLDMHNRSGLLTELDEMCLGRTGAPSPRQMVKALTEWLAEHGINGSRRDVHLLGSSVHFDISFLTRAMMGFEELFHHRRLDVSSVKVMVDALLPALAKERDAELRPVRAHRALPDIYDTLDELRFYGHKLGEAWG